MGVLGALLLPRGIPLFVRKLPYSSDEPLVLDTAWLSEEFASKLLPSIGFHALGSREIAFRELLYPRFVSYTPLMHGLIRLDKADRSVHVIGHANVFPLAFAACLIVFVTAGMAGDPLAFRMSLAAFGAVVFGLLYVVQAGRYRAVCRAVEKQASQG